MIRFIVVLSIFTIINAFAEEESKGSIPPEIRIAVVSPTTGNWGPYGTEIVRGAMLAVEDLQGPKGPIKLLVEDACLPADTVRSIHKLIDIDDIKGVVGSYCVVGTVPMAAITEKKHILAFHTSAVADPILNAGDYTFTTNITIRDEAKSLAELAYNTFGYRKAAVLYLLTQWGDDYQKYFIDRFKELGGTVVISLENPIGTSDFRTELTKIKTAKPDMIFMAHVGAELATALKQARQINLSVPVLGAHEVEEQGVLDLAGSASEGLTFLSPTLPTSGNKVLNFRTAFRAKYGTEPGILATNGYDATNLVVNSLRECKLSTECAKDKIYAVKDYAGMSGVFSITPEGGTVKTFIRKTVKNGKFEFLS